MRVIGLTGGIACGKSTVSGHLRARGVPVVDADAISRMLTAPGGAGVAAVAAAFPDEVREGVMDRAALARRVFADPSARKALEDVLHPLIVGKMRAQLSCLRARGASVAALDVPLLFEAGLEDMATEVWVVTAGLETQIARLRARDGMTREQALARIAAQMPLALKAARADVVIDNDAAQEDALAAVDAALGGQVCG